MRMNIDTFDVIHREAFTALEKQQGSERNSQLTFECGPDRIIDIKKHHLNSGERADSLGSQNLDQGGCHFFGSLMLSS